MNIDLLVTQQGEAGLVSDQEFESPVAGIMFDNETRQLTIEFSNMDTAEMNIPVEDDISNALLWAASLQVGVILNNQVQDNRQVPLMLLNDPEGTGMRMPVKSSNSVIAFENFLKSCVTGQPIHRDDLGDEDGTSSVVGGVNRAVLQFAPHLARQRSLEATHDLNMSGPSAPGMGLGGGGGGGGRISNPQSGRNTGRSDYPQRGQDEDEG